MKSLLIDTSTEALIIILSDENKVIDYVLEIIVKDHSTHLIPRIADLLERNHVNIKQIDSIIVTEGPGSYTGVRIGVTVVKTLGYTLNIPVKKISALKLMSASVITLGKYIVPIIDARRGNVFSALYKVENNKLSVLIPEGLYTFSALLNQINLFEEIEKVSFVAVKTYPGIVNLLLLENIFDPALIMQSDFENIDNLHLFVPNYRRLPEAEINLNENRKNNK